MIDENKLIDELSMWREECIETEQDKVWNHAINRCIREVKKQPKLNEWVPVEERFPEEKEYVLIQNPYGVMSVACMLDGRWYNWQGTELWTAVSWMPLPVPYKEIR